MPSFTKHVAHSAMQLVGHQVRVTPTSIMDPGCHAATEVQLLHLRERDKLAKQLRRVTRSPARPPPAYEVCSPGSSAFADEEIPTLDNRNRKHKCATTIGLSTARANYGCCEIIAPLRRLLWFLSGCVITLVAVGTYQRWLSVIAAQDSTLLLTVLGGIVASGGVLIALAALAVSAWGQLAAARTASWDSTRDLLWHFNKRWGEIYDSRVKADEFLKTTPVPAYSYNRDLTEVLDHFESMGFFGNKHHLDDEKAWQFYFDEAADLWNRAIDYIAWRRKSRNDWTLFCEYEQWIHRLAGINTARTKSAERQKRIPTPVAATWKTNFPASEATSQVPGKVTPESPTGTGQSKPPTS